MDEIRIIHGEIKSNLIYLQNSPKKRNVQPAFSAFDNNDNKTAGYHCHILRLPISVEKAFKMMKTFVFSKKNTPFYRIF